MLFAQNYTRIGSAAGFGSALCLFAPVKLCILVYALPSRLIKPWCNQLCKTGYVMIRLLIITAAVCSLHASCPSMRGTAYTADLTCRQCGSALHNSAVVIRQWQVPLFKAKARDVPVALLHVLHLAGTINMPVVAETCHI